MSPRKVNNPAKDPWKLWLNSLHPKPTLKSEPFGLGQTLQAIYQGFAHIVQPLHKYLSGEGARKKNEWVMFMDDV